MAPIDNADGPGGLGLLIDSSDWAYRGYRFGLVGQPHYLGGTRVFLLASPE
jgi:hypothetical protein